MLRARDNSQVLTSVSDQYTVKTAPLLGFFWGGGVSCANNKIIRAGREA